MENPITSKGVNAEEALRNYFRSLGYFVVRGISVNYKDIEITDVDLWLYIKSNTLSSERTCVDIKNKKIPQAMERVLWTKGLQEILKVDRAIVVTTDNRIETRTFGIENGVIVLQGDFQRRVISGFTSSNRITEEELNQILKYPCILKSHIDWKKWNSKNKSLLLEKLNFDGCNSLLESVKFLLEEYLASNKQSEPSIRLLYSSLSYFLICLDFHSRSYAHLDTTLRNSILTNGFRYGESGQQRTEEIIRLAFQLIANTGKTDLFTKDALNIEFNKQISDYPAEFLAEYFSKPDSIKNYFSLATKFEDQSYQKKVLHPNELSSELKGIIGLICDFFRIDRKKII